MAGGEVCFDIFSKVVPQFKTAIPTDVPGFTLNECCFELPALVDAANPTDLFRNDQHAIIAKYDFQFFLDVTIFIQKFVGGTFADQVEVSDNSFGEFFSFGTFGSSDGRQFYVALTIDWLKIFNAFGEGSYRFRFKEIDFSSNETETIYPFQFCVQTYTKDRANRTVRFETFTEGLRGDVNNDFDTWDFTVVAQTVGGDGWFNQWRFPNSFFGFNKSSYEREFVRFQNGQEIWTLDEQVESYTWNSGQYPATLHDYIKNDILQADRIIITDYNSNNPNIIKEKAVNVDSNYEPEWQFNNKRAVVIVDFVQEFQNKRKRRC